MGGRPKAPPIPKEIPFEPLKDIPHLIDFVSGQETVEVTDGAGRKTRVVRAIPKDQIPDILPDLNEQDAERLAAIPFVQKLEQRGARGKKCAKPPH